MIHGYTLVIHGYTVIHILLCNGACDDHKSKKNNTELHWKTKITPNNTLQHKKNSLTIMYKIDNGLKLAMIIYSEISISKIKSNLLWKRKLVLLISCTFK